MDYDVLASLLDREALAKYKKHALNPHTNPVERGGAENDDIYFQGREEMCIRDRIKTGYF